MFANRNLLNSQNRPPLARRKPGAEIPNVFDVDLAKPFELEASVGYGQGANRRKDVALVEKALEQAGYLSEGRKPTGHMSRELDQATQNFQRDSEKKIDGRLDSGGETIHALASLFGQSAPKRKQVEERSYMQAISVDNAAVSANARTVRHLMRTKENGMLPQVLSETFGKNDKAQAEVANLFAQLQIQAPERAQNLYEQTASQLTTSQQNKLSELVDEQATERYQEAGTSLDVELETSSPPDEVSNDMGVVPNEKDRKEICATLKEQHKSALAEFRAAEGLLDDSEKNLKKAQKDFEEKLRRYDIEIVGLVLENVIPVARSVKVAGKVLRGASKVFEKGKRDQDFEHPSLTNPDAIRAYEEAKFALQLFIDERNRAQEIYDEKSAHSAQISKELEKNGCATSR